MLSSTTEQILQVMESELALGNVSNEKTKRIVLDLLQSIEELGLERPNNIEDFWLWVNRAISEIDHKITDQLNAILHHERFIEIESTWRSLYDLVDFSIGRKKRQDPRFGR